METQQYVTYFRDNKEGIPRSIQACIRHFETKVFTGLLQEKRCWVGGGAIRDFFLGDKPTDYDLFFPTESAAQNALPALRKRFPSLRIIKENNRTIKAEDPSSGMRFDLVKIPHESPYALIKSFDFTVCCAVVAHGKLILHRDYFMDLASRRLLLNTNPTTYAIMYRLQKYIAKGFAMDNVELAKIVKVIRSLDPEDPKVNLLEFYNPPEVLEHIETEDEILF